MHIEFTIPMWLYWIAYAIFVLVFPLPVAGFVAYTICEPSHLGWRSLAICTGLATATVVIGGLVLGIRS